MHHSLLLTVENEDKINQLWCFTPFLLQQINQTEQKFEQSKRTGTIFEKKKKIYVFLLSYVMFSHVLLEAIEVFWLHILGALMLYIFIYSQWLYNMDTIIILVVLLTIIINIINIISISVPQPTHKANWQQTFTEPQHF